MAPLGYNFALEDNFLRAFKTFHDKMLCGQNRREGEILTLFSKAKEDSDFSEITGRSVKLSETSGEVSETVRNFRGGQ